MVSGSSRWLPDTVIERTACCAGAAGAGSAGAGVAGADGAVVVGKLMESTDPSYGYDAQNGVFVDMFKAGIIDPTKVVRTALQDAASVAGLLITTEALIADKPEPKGGPSMPPGGGMGGMGGMGDMGF